MTVVEQRPSADERFTALARAGRLHCPLCGAELKLDPLWPTHHWLCANGHSYSNARALLAELAEYRDRPLGTVRR